MSRNRRDNTPLTAADYPLSEVRPDLVKSLQNKGLDDISMSEVSVGEVSMADLRITAQALRYQADIARASQRAALAANFERAAEMTRLPQDKIMAIYELLRPGRAESRQVLEATAAELRQDYDAPHLADHLDEAAELYERRGLFRSRF